MTGLEELEKTVLGLPVDQRARLAQSLLDSLPPALDELPEDSEIEEAERREREIEAGRVEPISEAELWRRVEASRRQ